MMNFYKYFCGQIEISDLILLKSEVCIKTETKSQNFGT